MQAITTSQKIRPFLWFNENAEEAMNYYVSVFRNAKAGDVVRMGEGAPGEPGKVFTVTFEIEGLQFYALNGGPLYTFSQATSFFVNCDTQEEIDHLWEKLCDGGEPSRCGWVTDRFGVTWQIVPSMLGDFLGGPDPAGSARAMQAMLGMVKLEIEGLRRAYEGS